MDICGWSIPKRKITSTKAMRREQAWLAEESKETGGDGSRISFYFYQRLLFLPWFILYKSLIYLSDLNRFRF